MSLSNKTRLFLILFLLGMAGVLSFLLVDLSALVALVPVPAGSEIPKITWTLKLLSLVQPTVILVVAVLVGVTLAPKVRLSAPLAEALAKGSDPARTLKPQIVPGIVGGVLGGVFIALTSLLFKPLLPPDTIVRLGKFGKLLPLPTRLLYGGITEELLLRWGLLTLLVWLIWRFLQKGRAIPTPACFVSANLLSALVFGLGHLPVAFLLLPEARLAVVLFVIIANLTFGVIAGHLFCKKGLESAMIAHMCCHVVLVVASSVGAYF